MLDGVAEPTFSLDSSNVISTNPPLGTHPLPVGLSQITVYFSTGYYGGFRLDSAGRDGVFGSWDDMLIPLSVYSTTGAIWSVLDFTPLPVARYRLTLPDLAWSSEFMVGDPTPRFSVFGNEMIYDGDPVSLPKGTDFGRVLVGGPGTTRSYTVSNDGAVDVYFGPVSVPTGYTLVEGLISSLAPGSSDSFTVRLNADTTGVFPGSIGFSSNHPDVGFFDFLVSATVVSPPVVSTTPFPLLYVEDSGAVTIDDYLMLSDASVELGSATVQLSQGYRQGEDVLALPDLGWIHGSFDPSTGTLSLSGRASAGTYQTALRLATYRNTSNAPDLTPRTFSFQVMDGEIQLYSNIATRTIELVAVNDRPTDISLGSAGILENQSSGMLVGTFSATDPDPGDTFEYALVSGGGDDDNDSFIIVGNQLLTTAPLDFESQPSCRIRVACTDAGGSNVEKPLVVQVLNQPEVCGRHVFYNNSSFDGRNAAANAADDNAIAPAPAIAGHGHAGQPASKDDELWKELGKRALLPGEEASFVNYTSYTKGINGIMVDFDQVNNAAGLGPEDFEFHVCRDPNTEAWQPLGVDPSVSVRPKDLGGRVVDRVTLVWPDNTIRRQWLRVIVKTTGDTGLGQPDVFYFGNAVGETGDKFGAASPNAYVNATDIAGVKVHVHSYTNPSTICDPYDFDRNGRVNAADVSVIKQNASGYGTSLVLFGAPPLAATTGIATVSLAHDMVLAAAGMQGDGEGGDRISSSPAAERCLTGCSAKVLPVHAAWVYSAGIRESDEPILAERWLATGIARDWDGRPMDEP